MVSAGRQLESTNTHMEMSNIESRVQIASEVRDVRELQVALLKIE